MKTNNYFPIINRFNLGSLFLATQSLFLATSALAETTTTTIDGVIAPGTSVEFIKDKFEGTEGPITLPDGSLIFTETRANRITRIAPDNSISTFLENTNGSNGLAFNKKGELISVQVVNTRVGIVYPAGHEKVFTEAFEGKLYQRPNDLVINKKGNVYFTDSGGQANAPADATKNPPGVYFVTAKGEVTRLLGDIERPNGIQLSPDEKTLYVANTAGEYLLSYPILGEGKLGPKKEFAKLAGYEKGENGFSSGADGIAIDNDGRVYVASNKGVEIFNHKGEALGIIPIPQKPQNLAFAGKDKKTLYIVGRGAAYKIPVLTPGFKDRAK